MTWDLRHRGLKCLTVTYQLTMHRQPLVTNFVNLSLPAIPWGGERALLCILERAWWCERKSSRSSSQSRWRWEKQPTPQSLKSVTSFLLCLPLTYMRSSLLLTYAACHRFFLLPSFLHFESLQVSFLLKHHEWSSGSYWIKFKLLLCLIYIGIKISLTSYKP